MSDPAGRAASPQLMARRGIKNKLPPTLPASFPTDHSESRLSLYVHGSRAVPATVTFQTSDRMVVSGKLGTRGKHTAQSRPLADSLKYFFLRKNIGKLVKIFTLILSFYPGLTFYFPFG